MDVGDGPRLDYSRRWEPLAVSDTGLLPECVEVELMDRPCWCGCVGVGTESRIPRYSHHPMVTEPVVSPSRKIQSRVALSALGFSHSSLSAGGLDAVPHDGHPVAMGGL